MVGLAMTDRSLTFTWLAALIAVGIIINLFVIIAAKADTLGSPHDMVQAHAGYDAYARARTTKVRSTGRPRAWCGWWLANRFGFAGSKARKLWLARNWAVLFPRAPLAPGNVAVFSRGRRGGHVGEIIAVHNNRTITMISGNDGGAVRTRPRSLRGLIAVVNPRGWRTASR